MGKLAAVVLLVISVFYGAGFGLNAIQGYTYLEAENYRETPVFHNLVWQKLHGVSEAFALQERLKDESLDYVSRRQMEDRVAELRESFSETESNLRFIVRDEKDETVFDLMHQGDQYDGSVVYASFVLGEYDVVMHNNAIYTGMEEVQGASPVYTIECTVVGEEQLSRGAVQDEFYRLWEQYHQANTRFTYWTNMLLACLVVAVACVLYILWTAGHRAGKEGIVLTWQEKIYFELYLAAMGIAWFLVFWLFIVFFLSGSMWWDLSQYLVNALRYADEILLLYRVGFCSAWVAFVGIAVLLLRTCVVRLKAHALRKTMLVCKLVEWLWSAGKRVICAMPFLWRTIALFVVYVFSCSVLFNIARYDGWAGFLLILLNLVALALLCWWSLGFQRLRKGSRAIAAGNLTHQISTVRMPPDLKEHAEDLNNLSVGLQQAVEQQMRSERFKAELITNVSHDLKTPLTSIINYVDLLQRTGDEQQRREYLEVLDRQSQQLKKLIEDLMEMSRASSGNVSVEITPTDVCEAVNQALGEFSDHLDRCGLTVMAKLPQEGCMANCDGRHLWRVLSNCLSNVVKYALPGTRVYVDVAKQGQRVEISIKNISAQMLNITAGELMERFVRGDASRNTEGNGLGLNIAKSLMELQGGRLELSVDGDLFKVVLTLNAA